MIKTQFSAVMSDADRNNLAIQYEPLVHKVANQMAVNSPMCYDDVLGAAAEGLAMAINQYDPTRSNGQTFLQYTAYQIRYNIHNTNNREGHIVKFSAYNQKKAKERGDTTFLMKSLDRTVGDDGEESYSIPEPIEDDPHVSWEVAYKDIYGSLEGKFTERDCSIFYMTFGLKDYEVTKGIDIAKKYHISGTSVTFVIQKMIKYIKTDEALMEELEGLYQNS